MILSLDSYFVFDGLLHTIFSSSSLLSMLFIRILLGAIFSAGFFFLVAVTRNTNSLMLSLSRSSGYALCESVILELLEKIAFRLLLSKSVAKCEMLHNFYVHIYFSACTFFALETYKRGGTPGEKERSGRAW